MKLRMITLLLAGLLSGCSALHWGGENAGQSPGIHIEMPGVFGGGGVSATADTTAKAELIQYGDELGRTFEARNIEFGQDAATVLREEPAKIDAIARLQMTQAEYARVTWEGVQAVAQELVPLVKLLAAAEFSAGADGLIARVPIEALNALPIPRTPEELKSLFQDAAETLDTLAPAPAEPALPGPAPETVP